MYCGVWTSQLVHQTKKMWLEIKKQVIFCQYSVLAWPDLMYVATQRADTKSHAQRLRASGICPVKKNSSLKELAILLSAKILKFPNNLTEINEIT